MYPGVRKEAKAVLKVMNFDEVEGISTGWEKMTWRFDNFFLSPFPPVCKAISPEYWLHISVTNESLNKQIVVEHVY